MDNKTYAYELIIDIKNIKNLELMEQWRLNDLLKTIIDELKFEVENKMCHELNFIYLFQNGHLNLYIHPDKTVCFINIFCSDLNYSFDNFISTIKIVEQFFKIEKVDLSCDILMRGK